MLKMSLENKILECETMKSYLFMSDTHCPFEDKNALKIVKNVIEDKKPDTILFGGDMIDAYIASKFNKEFMRHTIQDEFDHFVEKIYKPIYERSPDSEYIFLEGNHCARIVSKAMEEHAFAEIRALTLQNLMKEACEHAGLPPMEVKQEYEILYGKKPIFLFKHGNKANKYAANSELELENISGISGHVHRSDTRTKTTRNGTIQWRSVGHLCDVSQQGYTKKNFNTNPNWNQGFGFVTVYHGYVFPQAVDIINYRCQLHGKVYKP